MKVRKAVITAAARHQRQLPLQTIFDAEGVKRSVLDLVVGEVARAEIPAVCVVVAPGDQEVFAETFSAPGVDVQFIEQTEPRGYGHAVLSAREFTGGEPFLHLVGDHIYVGQQGRSVAQELVEAAEAKQCAVSAVQVTRETLLPYFGSVGGQRLHDLPQLYQVETVLEKPTPTEAELKLQVSGLRAGQYLCFFGMHVLTPTVMTLLEEALEAHPDQTVTLSAALSRLPSLERYLALEASDAKRYDVGRRYGIFLAQLALALEGRDREFVLSQMFEVAAARGSLLAEGDRA